MFFVYSNMNFIFILILYIYVKSSFYFYINCFPDSLRLCSAMFLL